MTAEETARSIVATLQAATDSRDPDAMLACFAPGSVLVGSARYNAGDEAVGSYLRLVADGNGSLRWHLARYDVFLRTDGLIGFGAEGEVEWTDDDGSGRGPFRMTIVATDHGTGHGWRILHFHGSLPAT